MTTIKYLFLDINFDSLEPVTISREQEIFHQIKNVLRLKKGDCICTFNGRGASQLMELHNCNQEQIIVIPRGPADNSSSHNQTGLTLLLSISSAAKFEFVLQKAVEMGVIAIRPLFCERSKVVSPPEKWQQKKMARWNKIIKSSCAQSRQTTLPSLLPPLEINDLFTKLTPPGPPQELGLLFTPGKHNARAGQFLRQFSPMLAKQQIQIAIGPEGGFSPEEIEIFTKNHFHPLSLGDNILRYETAVIAIISVLQFLRGNWG